MKTPQILPYWAVQFLGSTTPSAQFPPGVGPFSASRSSWGMVRTGPHGSLAIRVAQLKGEDAEPPASRTPLPAGGSLDELESVIAEIASEEDERTKSTVRELLGEPLKFKTDESAAGLSIETVQSVRFIGQVIRDGERIVYASLPTTKNWLADNKWQSTEPFAI